MHTNPVQLSKPLPLRAVPRFAGSRLDLEDSFYCNGGYIVNGERIKCWKHAGHGSQNLTRATENSCNCCFMKLALTMGTEKFYDYLYAFAPWAKHGKADLSVKAKAS